MIRYSLIIFFLFFSYTCAQNLNLDSLYTKYINSQSHRIQDSKSSVANNVTPDHHEKCGFGLAAAVYFNFERFTPEQQNIIKKIMDRPDLSNEYVSPFGHFKIHYDVSGSNKPAFDNSKSALQNVELIAAALDSVYKMIVEEFGFPPPPADNNLGGDDLYDIYIENQANYGGTQPEEYIPNDRYTSYMSIDNDFSGFYTEGLAAAKVTLAHEFHHAIQMGNYAIRYTGGTDPEDLFFFELTSTAMEEFVFDYVNDYYNYIRDYFNNPEKNFEKYPGYALVLWNLFLYDRYGISIVKRQWEFYRSSRAYLAINNSLAEAGSSFKRELNLFGIWSYYTGYRKKLAVENNISGEGFGYFEEGENYPLIRVNSMNYTPNLFPINVSTYPMANNFVKVINLGGTPAPDTIISIITNGDLSALISSPNSLYDVNYSLFDNETDGTKHMVNNYYYKLDAVNQEFYADANIFNNKVVNGGEYILSETDFAYPMPFYYNESRNEKIYVPVAYNRLGEARLYVYTPDMNLIYDGSGKIITPNDKFVLEWNVRDSENNKLPSGVYIYVTESDDNIKKGKIVIFSE